MNWLAHIFLAEDRIEFQFGGLLADPIKGRTWDSASETLRAGIFMHQMIDKFTDQHELTKYAFLIPLHMQRSASTDRSGFKTVSRMDAAAERTGKYSQRVLNPALSVQRCTNSVTLNTSDRELGTLI